MRGKIGLQGAGNWEMSKVCDDGPSMFTFIIFGQEFLYLFHNYPYADHLTSSQAISSLACRISLHWIKLIQILYNILFLYYKIRLDCNKLILVKLNTTLADI